MRRAPVWVHILGLGAVLMGISAAFAQTPSPMQKIGGFSIDRTEVTIAAFAKFAAASGFRSLAEKQGGSLVYEAGWTKKTGWNWRAPFGKPAKPLEPAVHVTFAEAKAYCAWTGKRLPTDKEWLQAAFTETRPNPPAPFVRGKRYPYPTGASPAGANCLSDCGKTSAIDYSAVLIRGKGHALAGSTKAGVNGLYDMGGNVWEWVDTSAGSEKVTRGGSWWYGAAQMQASYQASKPPGMAVVYIGFRCARDLP